MTGLRVPAATYRLQFNSEFGFHEAEPLITYLHALGITDLYASPLLQAREGSEHGYDVTDPRRIDPDVGGRKGFAELSAALRAHGMGLLLDIVPNHMAANAQNPWWRDILRWGQHSEHAAKFDINWQADRGKPGAEVGKLILPILGSPLAEVFSKEEFKLALGADGLEILYNEHHLPVCPASYGMILAEPLTEKVKTPAGAAAAGAAAVLTERIGRATSTGSRKETAPAGKRLWELYHDEEEVRDFLDEVLHFWNNGTGRKRFPALLAAQHYRPVFWKETGQRINYRRFFDINDLVTLRIEDEEVFRAVHGRVLEMVQEGAVTGLRVDHVDGMHDPEAYLLRLQAYLAAREPDGGSAGTAAGLPAAGQAALHSPGEAGFYVVVEKILGKGEALPSSWPVAGTTGYDFLNSLNGLFVHAPGLEQLHSFYTEISGSQADFAALVYKQKKLVMQELFTGEMADLSEKLVLLAAADEQGKGSNPDDLSTALVEVTAAFPVYRTYIREFSVTPRDRQYIEEALQLAAKYGDSAEQARAFLRRLLLLEFPPGMPQGTRQEWLAFVMRWQQFSGPIMAKGFEDTALYVYNRLLSLNEVGSDPAGGSVAVEEFHRRMLARCADAPHTMNATSTHDTKRSEDVRARLNLLAEIPQVWAERVRRWQEWNAAKKPLPGGQPLPEGNAELLLYQTLAGAWPLDDAGEAAFKERLAGYLVKASREAKTHTSWLEPDEAYEEAFCAFARDILDDSGENLFREDLLRLVRPLAYYGAFNSLAQLVLKAVCPGVPDFFMGSELWDYSLVDPDNRRPVDFPRRRELLAKLQQRERGAELARELLQTWEDGRLKLYVTWKALELRRGRAGMFSYGGYIPLEATGAAREHVCALARHAGGDWVLAAVPRLPLRLAARVNPAALTEFKAPTGREYWADTALQLPKAAPGRWQDIFTGETYNADRQSLPMDSVLGIFPVALLTPLNT